LQANKVLAKALHILKSKLAEAQQQDGSELAELRARLAASEERANNAEHTVNVLRWHLQASTTGGSTGVRTPPDVF
jgi:hypothetical protein